MNYHHFDHLDAFAVGLKVGDRVKRGQLAGYCGRSGTTSPHCHYEVMARKPNNWLQYTWNMSREAVAALYPDPKAYITGDIPMKWNRYGYRYLDRLTRVVGGVTQIGWHPGVDLNWGSGADDFRFPVYFTVDGVIEYMGRKETDGGAGNNLWFSEQSMPTEPTLENTLVQDVEGTGAFAFVLGGKKRHITAERAGLAALTLTARAMKYRALTKAEWAALPEGDAF